MHIFTPTQGMIDCIYQVRVRVITEEDNSPTKLVPRFFGNTTIYYVHSSLRKYYRYEVILEGYCNNITDKDATTSGVALPAELAAFNEIKGA